jgi:hypothetical protein
VQLMDVRKLKCISVRSHKKKGETVTTKHLCTRSCRNKHTHCHGLHSPPAPPREQLCNRYCSNKHTRTSPHRTRRLVVSRSTCPPLSRRFPIPPPDDDVFLLFLQKQKRAFGYHMSTIIPLLPSEQLWYCSNKRTIFSESPPRERKRERESFIGSRA